MQKKIMILLMAALMMCLGGCGEGNLIGKWVCTSDSGAETIELFSDGTGTLIEDDISYEITWIAENGRLKISASVGLFGEYSMVSDYELNKDTLTLTDEGDGSTIYERK